MNTTLEEVLLHLLLTPPIQFAQWAYAIWQIVRSNAFVLFVLSLPVYLWQIYYKEKKVVVVGETGDYVMPLEDMTNHQWRTLTIVKYEHDNKLCALKHGEYYYYALTDCLRELAECELRFGENAVFVEKLLPITDAISVGKMISQTEAYEKVLSSQGYHISEGPLYVVPSRLDYVDVSSKFWGFLSTIPVLLQAMSYNRVSALLSFVIIVVDLNRHRLYRVYDGVFDRFAKFVKNHIFKERKTLYYISSFFSRRWNYSYVIDQNVPIKIRPYCKLKSMEGLNINNDFGVYGKAPKIENLCVEIDIDRANVSLMQNNVLYMEVVLNRPVYVPALNLQWQQQALWQHQARWQQLQQEESPQEEREEEENLLLLNQEWQQQESPQEEWQEEAPQEWQQQESPQENLLLLNQWQHDARWEQQDWQQKRMMQQRQQRLLQLMQLPPMKVQRQRLQEEQHQGVRRQQNHLQQEFRRQQP